MPDDTPPTAVPAPARSRRRRNVFGGSPHRDEYVRLLEGGWTSTALERYALHRYGEDVPASTIRQYKMTKGIVAKVDRFAKVEADQFVDVMGDRADLIRLQQARIAIDFGHETQMNKLFGSVRGEIQILNQLLNDARADQQAVGLMPVAGEKLELSVPTMESVDAPKARSLGELLGWAGASAIEQAGLAKALHLASRNGQRVDGNGNGHAASG